MLFPFNSKSGNRSFNPFSSSYSGNIDKLSGFKNVLYVYLLSKIANYIINFCFCIFSTNWYFPYEWLFLRDICHYLLQKRQKLHFFHMPFLHMLLFQLFSMVESLLKWMNS